MEILREGKADRRHGGFFSIFGVIGGEKIASRKTNQDGKTFRQRRNRSDALLLERIVR